MDCGGPLCLACTSSPTAVPITSPRTSNPTSYNPTTSIPSATPIPTTLTPTTAPTTLTPTAIPVTSSPSTNKPSVLPSEQPTKIPSSLVIFSCLHPSTCLQLLGTVPCNQLCSLGTSYSIAHWLSSVVAYHRCTNHDFTLHLTHLCKCSYQS